MNKNEIITIKQLPVIEEQLQMIKKDVTARVENALSLVCTEETVKDVKKERAALNSELKYWEEKRKLVKNEVMAPYNAFEAVYKECISDVFKNADADLKEKIDSVESELKAKKQTEVEAYFNEYLAAMNIDFVTFQQACINVTLSASLKSLKEAAKTFIDKIADDLSLIETQEFKDEILVEYKRTLNVSAAITGTVARHKAIEEEQARRAEIEAQKAAEAEAVAKVEEVLAAPEPIAPPVEEEKTVQMSFTVKGTLAQLKELKQYIVEKGIEIL